MSTTDLDDQVYVLWVSKNSTYYFEPSLLKCIHPDNFLIEVVTKLIFCLMLYCSQAYQIQRLDFSHVHTVHMTNQRQYRNCWRCKGLKPGCHTFKAQFLWYHWLKLYSYQSRWHPSIHLSSSQVLVRGWSTFFGLSVQFVTSALIFSFHYLSSCCCLKKLHPDLCYDIFEL